MINYRSFGNTGFQVSEIGLGCSDIGGGVFYKDDKESIRLLHRAFELGINFYDTADIYGYGHSEELIGRVFKGRRSQIIFASKAGFLFCSYEKVYRAKLKTITDGLLGFISTS
jgi:aryl-alcohol dehydrogenase-like predicted oxidoreductase